jgi:2-oxoisovalerate dehydrogenase E2 component (dihydrolipoyl transacylase)
VADYKLPDVGEGLTEAEIVTWKVKVGDVIEVNDIVVEIETAKSLVELPSPYAGTVLALHVPEGQTVAVGTPIISIGDPEAAAAAPAAAPAAPAEIDMSNPAATGGGENQTLVGYGPRATSGLRRARRGGASPATDAGAAAQLQLQGAFGQGAAETADVVEADEPPVPATSVVAAPASADQQSAGQSSGQSAGQSVEQSAGQSVEQSAGQSVAQARALAKPPVRKLAKDLGIDLRTLTPTGPGGTVTREDVQAATTELSQPQPTRTASAPDTSVPGRGVREVREPIKGVRKMMAQAMVDSAFTAPHVTEWVTVDVTRTMRLVARLQRHRDFRDLKVSPLLVVAKAVCLAVRRTPEVNATWDDAAQEVVLKSYVNLGIAAATPRGLVVPNVKGAEALSLPELATALGDLTRTAREGRTQPAEMSGGSFTITNVGVFGVDAGTPIINPGESAILCFGAVRQQAWVHKGKVKARDVTTLALSFDHRLVDGEKGSRFLADVAAVLNDPSSALLF